MVHVWSLNVQNLTAVSVCTQHFSKTRRSTHKWHVTTGFFSRAKYRNRHTAGEHEAQGEVCSRDLLLLGHPLKSQEEEELVARVQCGWFLVLTDSLELCKPSVTVHVLSCDLSDFNCIYV